MDHPLRVIELPALSALIPLLARRGYQVVGPTVCDGAITLDTLEKLEDLPAGWTDEQECGQYRISRRGDGALFGYNLGPQSWKKYLHPPELRMLAAERRNGTFEFVQKPQPAPRYAFLGVRPCELAAIQRQDRVFLGDRYIDPGYQARRKGVFLISVNCTQAARTCFCTSMGTGPKAGAGFDLCLTEVIRPGGHIFLVETGTEAGAEVLAELETREPRTGEIEAAGSAVDAAAGQIVRSLDTAGLPELLYDAFDDPRWDRIAARCLSCANCTMVCPTCFCTTVEDWSDVTGEHAERWRRWDSCFTESFSYIHGGSVRQSVKSRYRQWLTHKMAAWHEQFGSSGCVGCGRCITWCPGRIDITEEIRAMRGVEPVGQGEKRNGN